MNDLDISSHLLHCNVGEYEGSCKYGDDDCIALLADENARLKDTIANLEAEISMLRLYIEILSEPLPETFKIGDRVMHCEHPQTIIAIDRNKCWLRYDTGFTRIDDWPLSADYELVQQDEGNNNE